MSTQKELADAVHKALERCADRLRAWVDESAENRRADVGYAVKAAEDEIMVAIRKAWPRQVP